MHKRWGVGECCGKRPENARGWAGASGGAGQPLTEGGLGFAEERVMRFLPGAQFTEYFFFRLHFIHGKKKLNFLRRGVTRAIRHGSGGHRSYASLRQT